MARRFARLWPLHLCGLVLCFVWLAWLVWNDATDIGWGTLLSGFGANLLFLPSVVGRDISPINPPAWSLLMEFGANALMALFAIRRSTRGLVIMLAVMAVVLVADMTLTQTMTPFEGGTSVANTGYRWHDVHLGVVRTMFSFLFGMVLARSLAGASPRASRWALVAMVAVPVLLLLPLTGWARFGFDLAFILIASPLLVRAGRGCNCPRGGRGLGCFWAICPIRFTRCITSGPIPSRPMAIITAGRWVSALRCSWRWLWAARCFVQNSSICPSEGD
jgi:peptidoglycan/LPS O-acetylase OafA/YrhL